MSTLLIADADLRSVQDIARAAARLGLRLSIAENGIEALERFRSERPRIVVLNRILPILDGIQVCQKIRESTVGSVTPVILIGELLREDGRSLRERLRLSDVLEKPFSTEDAIRAIAPFLPDLDEAFGPPIEPPSRFCPVVDTPTARVLIEVVADHRTGEIVWRRGTVTRSLFVRDGMVVGGRSNSARDLWPAWAIRDPQLGSDTRSRLAALAVPGPGSEGWAAYLEIRAAFPKSEYEASVNRWLVSSALEMMRAKEGEISFHDDSQPTVSSANIAAGPIALFGLRETPGKAYATLLPDPMTLLGVTRGDDGFSLTHVEQQILTLADGAHTVGDLLALGRLIQHDVRPFLYGMLMLGNIQATPPLREDLGTESNDVYPDHGDLTQTHVGLVLTRFANFGRSGTLQVRNSQVQTSVHLCSGQIVFARSTDESLRLGKILLKTGAIALEDHRRALALQTGQRDRRLGSILLSIGALSLKELHHALSTQIRAILADLFTWTSGEWTFTDGTVAHEDRVTIGGSTPGVLLGCFRVLPSAVAGAHLPAAEVFIVKTWNSGRISRLLQLNDTERHITAAATRARRTSDIGIGAQDAPSLLGLLAIGCLTASANEPAPAAASKPAATELQEETGNQIQRLRSAVAKLTSRVAELEVENASLKRQLLQDVG